MRRGRTMGRWLRGLRGRARTRCRPRLPCRRRRSAARLVWRLRRSAERCGLAGPRAVRVRGLDEKRDPTGLRRGHSHDPRSHRRWRHLPGESHASAAESFRRRSTLRLPDADRSPARGLWRLPRYREPGRPLGEPRALLSVGSGRGAGAADEGNHVPRPLVGRRPGAAAAALRVGEGPGREPDDRRSPPQRPGPHRGHRQRDRAQPVRHRAIRHGLADDLDRDRPAAPGCRAGRRVSGALPVRLRHRSTQGPYD